VSAPVETICKGGHDQCFLSKQQGRHRNNSKPSGTYRKGDQTNPCGGPIAADNTNTALRQRSFTSANPRGGRPANTRWKCFLTTSRRSEALHCQLDGTSPVLDVVFQHGRDNHFGDSALGRIGANSETLRPARPSGPARFNCHDRFESELPLM
jgi:hypothetical protein